jgi:hypothetical protein
MKEHENWTRNGKPNRNEHMDETEIIILKKRRSNTEKAMTRTGTAEMRRSLVELLDENIRGFPGHHLPVKTRWSTAYRP